MWRSRATWDALIGRDGELALLRQVGLSDRWIVCILGQFSAMERLGGISNPADLKALVAITSPDTGTRVTPDPSERDALVTLQYDHTDTIVTDSSGNPVETGRLKIIAPMAPIGTRALSKQLYWRLQVRR
jgi:hypothetical protein